MNHVPILVLSHEFPPFGGGAGRNVSLLCRRLHEQGYGITLWTSGRACEEDRAVPFKIVRFDIGRKQRFETSVAGLLRFLLQGWFRLISFGKHRPAVVLSNMAIPAGLAFAFASPFLRRTVHIVWHHGSDVHGGNAHGPGLLQRLLLRRVWRSAAVNCFVSKSLMECAVRSGLPGAGAVVPVASEIAPPPADAGREGKTFVFFGRLEPVKNPLLFVNAVARFADRWRTVGASFRIVGSGALYETVEERIRTSGCGGLVTMSRELPFEQVSKVYSTAYAMVLTSIVEGFPTTVVEAGLFGVPCVAAASPGLTDAVADGKNGILFAAGNEDALAAAMHSLARDPTLRDRLGNGARATAQMYTVTATADAFLRAAGPFLINKPHNDKGPS